MPFKCRSCNVLSRTEDVLECQNKNRCNLRRVEVIHLAHEHGTGRKICTNQRSYIQQGNTVVKNTTLYLACDSTKEFPAYTPYRPGATCMDCLENIPPKAPIQDSPVSIEG